MEKINDLQALLKHELNDLYSAEVQLIAVLPKMLEAATNPKLKAAIKEHFVITRNHKKRLDEVRKLLKIDTTKPKGFWATLFSGNEEEEHCKAMKGLVREAKSLMRENMSPEVMDAALIAAAQKIEHYEISSYGTAKAFALKLKLSTVAKLLDETLKEEYAADNSLTELALAEVNDKAEDKAAKKRPAEGKNDFIPKKAPAPKKATDTGQGAGSNKAPAPQKATKKAATKKTATKSVAKAAAPKKPAKQVNREGAEKNATA